MDVIFNEFSIDEQYYNLEEFIDSLSKDTLPAMDYLEKKGRFLLLKSNTIFERNICPNVNFGFFLSRQSFGRPELIRFKSILVQILADPFWEDSIFTENDAVYNCEAIGTFNGSEPTCFSEAMERASPILSLRHPAFSNLAFAVEKNQIPYSVMNLFDKESTCEVLLKHKLIGFSEYLLRKKYPLEVIFLCNDNQHYFSDDCYENNEITIEDIKEIAVTFERHINHLCDGTSSKLTKSINHKGITYFEFRDKLSQNREFRIFYYRKEDKLIYLNSLLKKTQKTPNAVKDYSIKLIKDYCDYN